MSRGKIQSSARIQLTVEVPAGSTWGEDCNLAQVFKQSRDAAHEALKRALEGDQIKIIGQPVIIAVMAESK